MSTATKYGVYDVVEFPLLWMPSRKSLAVLGSKAKLFDHADGDLLLAASIAFNDVELALASEAGGKCVQGYAFDYPCTATVEAKGWCGDATRGVGFALSREVAETVREASYAAFKRELSSVMQTNN